MENIIEKKKLIVFGNDKISRWAYFELKKRGLKLSGFSVALDCSTNIHRIIRLIMNKKISITCLGKMIVSEFIREKFTMFKYDFRISSNEDLHKILTLNQYSEVYLFRVGLVINKKNLSLGAKLLNIHCANIPEYSGLCSIYRALKDRAIHQNACLHIVTTSIDDHCSIINREPYTLKPDKSYLQNERIAYYAGIKILYRCLSNAE
jgi:folate-dependent phosphoribosylglycinamide formyltransferase PurN